jgi:Lar family restriction alleviation protein
MKQTELSPVEHQTDNLAPCPFCGGAPVKDYIVNATYLIKCSSCRTRSWFQASAADAVAAWNRRAVKPFDAAPAPVLSDADYAAIVKRYEDAGDVQNADIIRRQRDVARASARCCSRPTETRMDAGSAAGAGQFHARPEDTPITVRTWRERIGVGLDFPLHAPTDVERAMVGEIAELRALIQAQDAPKSTGAPETCRSSDKVQKTGYCADCNSWGGTHSDECKRRPERFCETAPAKLHMRADLAEEVLATALWLYRRLPHGYGRPPTVERPILALAKLTGIDVAACLAERGGIESAPPEAS